MNFVMKTLSCSCWQITQRRSFSTTRSLTTHLEQASLCPQGPYPVNWIGSAQTAQHSSITTKCRHTLDCRPRLFREKYDELTFDLPGQLGNAYGAKVLIAVCSYNVVLRTSHTMQPAVCLPSPIHPRRFVARFAQACTGLCALRADTSTCRRAAERNMPKTSYVVCSSSHCAPDSSTLCHRQSGSSTSGYLYEVTIQCPARCSTCWLLMGDLCTQATECTGTN